MAGELILVIEDNERNRKLTKDVLEHAGFRVHVAGTGAEGVASAQRERPDLVLLDIGLPDEDGVVVLGRLRDDEATSAIPVVAVTAYAMPGDRETLLGSGFDGYVAKPIDVKTFAQEIATFMPVALGTPSDDERAGEVTILVVDDTPANVRLLGEMLVARGYLVRVARTGAEAIAAVEDVKPNLVLLDVQLPDFDGFEVCRRLRAAPATATLPVVMVTASVGQERVRALDAGADDFLTKPFDQAELFARIRSLVKIRDYQERMEAQAQELAALNRTLQERVDAQIAEVERLRQLRRFVSQHVADAILSSGNEHRLTFHRSEIAVLFCDLRGYTSFTGSVEPEESAAVMTQYHELLGSLVREYDATVGHFAGDGVMLFFNDPVPTPEPAMTAVKMGIAISDAMMVMSDTWRRRGHELGCGIGIAFGFATVGEMGFQERRDYGAIGGVCNLASRLCDEARAGQIVISARVCSEVDQHFDTESLGELSLKGFSSPVQAFSVLGPKDVG